MVSYKLSNSCFPYTLEMLLLFHTKAKETIVVLSQNFWAEISLSREPLVLHPVYRNDQALSYETLSKIRTYFSEGWTHMYIENQKYQWSNSFSCTWVLGNHCAGSQRWHSHQMGQMWMQFKGMHACWLIISGREHAEWVAVSTGPLFIPFCWFQREQKNKNNLPSLFIPLSPHPVP